MKLRPTCIALAGLVLAGLIAGACGANSHETPQGVASDFVQRYAVMTDLAGAKSMTTGMARQLLEEEMHLLSQIDPGADRTKGRESLRYELDRERESSSGRWSFQYSLLVGSSGRRQFFVTTKEVDGKWLVTNYTFPDAR